jgi:hypothetical protein
MKYLVEVFVTTNNLTGNETYYKMICDHPRRISKVDFYKIKEECHDYSCLFNKSDDKYSRSYVTCIFNLPF